MRVGIANQKGGVAKTTNTINVAGALAARGHDVLAVDADGQGYLSMRLGLREEYMADRTNLFNAVKEPMEVDPAELIVEHDEFDVLPSNIDMFRIEQELIADGWRQRERLDMVFDRLPEYDFIVVDAPPHLGAMNDNVLIATQNILIPIEASEDARLALEHLFRQVDTIERRYEVSIRELGILMSNVEHPIDNDQRDIIHWAGRFFRDRTPVFEIRNRKSISSAVNQNHSVFGADVESDQEIVYERIAEQLEDASNE